MTINIHSLSNLQIFNNIIALTLEDAEGVKLNPYYDTKQIPTIGIGISLTVPQNLSKLLVFFGFGRVADLTAAQKLTEQKIENKYKSIIKTYIAGDYIGNSALESDLNEVMSDTNTALLAAGLPSTTLVRSLFAFKNTEDAEAFLTEKILPSYNVQLGSSIIPSVPTSLERAALLSLLYNGIKLNGTKLAADVASDNRAEAWYEIRYDSNAANNFESASRNQANARGVAIRRDFESDLFGLYNGDPWADPSIVTNIEAVQIFAMVLDHESVLFASTKPNGSGLYNNQYYYNPDVLTLTANKNYATAVAAVAAQEDGFQVRGLMGDLAPAVNFLLISASATSSGDVLVFNQAANPTFDINLTSYKETSLAVFVQNNGGPQIVMNNGNDILYTSADDFIIEGSGIDHLTLIGHDYTIEGPGFGPSSNSVPAPLDTILFDGNSIAASLAGSGSTDLGRTYYLNSNSVSTTLTIEVGDPGSVGSYYLGIEGFNNGDYGVTFKNFSRSAEVATAPVSLDAMRFTQTMASFGGQSGLPSLKDFILSKQTFAEILLVHPYTGAHSHLA